MKSIVLVLPVLPHYRTAFLINLSNKLYGKGYKLYVFAGTNVLTKEIKEDERLNDEVEIKKTKTFGISIFGFKLQWQSRLISDVLKIKPSRVIFLFHAGKINYNILLIILKLRRIPVTIWGSGSGDNRSIRYELNKFQHSLKWFLKKSFFKLGDSYITYTHNYKAKLVDLGLDADMIFPAVNTIDVETIISKTENENISKGTSNVIRFLYVGAITKQKRIEIALSAFNALMEKGISNFSFDVVGKGTHLEDLKKETIRLNLEDKVMFHGPLYDNDLMSMFLKSDIFLLTGTGGLAINEAMAYGLPVISTPGDGVGVDLIKDGYNGFLMDYEPSIDELSTHLTNVIKMDSKSMTKMGEKSRETVMRVASMENMVEKFYQAIIYKKNK